jgi:hypothetical protein
MNDAEYGEMVSDIVTQGLILVVGSAILLALALGNYLHFKAVDHVVREGKIVSVPVVQMKLGGGKASGSYLWISLPAEQTGPTLDPLRRLSIFTFEMIDQCRSLGRGKIGCPTVEVFHLPGATVEAVLKSEFSDPDKVWRRFWFPYFVCLAAIPAFAGLYRIAFRRRLALRTLQPIAPA